jgi:putative ABC transport system substrate-binding protein
MYPSKAIGRLARTGVLGAWAAGLSLLASCHAPKPPPPPLVLFLGATKDDDGGFDSLQRAIARRHPEVAARIRFERIDADDRSTASLQRATIEALARHPDVLVAPNATTAVAAVHAAPRQRVIFSTYLDPIALGIVSSLGTRAEPVTGISLADRLHAKRMEILHDAYPSVRSVAVLADHEWDAAVDGERAMREATAGRSLAFHVFLADTRQEVSQVLESSEARRYDAWYIPRALPGLLAGDDITRRMRAWHTPCIYGSTEEVLEGGQIAYSQDTAFAWSTLSDLLARVVAGEPPGRIPVMHPYHFVLAIRTGEETGVPLPDYSVLRRADIVLR